MKLFSGEAALGIKPRGALPGGYGALPRPFYFVSRQSCQVAQANLEISILLPPE